MKSRVFILISIMMLLGNSLVLGQQDYTLKFSNISLRKKFPKQLKLDTTLFYTADKNFRALSKELIERGYFLHQINLDRENKVLIIDEGRQYEEIILRGIQSAELSVFSLN